jgi:hypothetical protein
LLFHWDGNWQEAGGMGRLRHRPSSQEYTRASITTFLRFLLTTENLHLSIAKWHKTKGTKEETILQEDSLFSFPISYL